mmetsp:Transcript_16012/g.30171  ORF Transcript_16012/g.30171 Transcript_16012/m.30171 type:complete len:142 (+) Transcript_16012:30-455(+)
MLAAFVAPRAASVVLQQPANLQAELRYRAREARRKRLPNYFHEIGGFPATRWGVLVLTAFRCSARGVRHRHVATQAEDEKASRSQDFLTRTSQKISEAWNDFWFGEYWSEEVPVYITPLTIVGVIVCLYGLEYSLAQFFRA